MEDKFIFAEADILLPNIDVSDKENWEKWAVIACDQFTSEPEYWEKAAEIAGNSYSALNLILPEAYLADSENRVGKINRTMDDYLEKVLLSNPGTMIYVERTLESGAVRHGIVGAIDLEEYDYCAGSHSAIRPTEGTVLERIPPRVAVRRGAKIELPHVMLLIDDAERCVIEPLSSKKSEFKCAYDFDLMLDGGHIRGYFMPKSEIERVKKLISENNNSDIKIAVGDGNHSLASAKAYYEELKKSISEQEAAVHPARYALAEIVNLHDDALVFEPIYRVMFNVDVDNVISELLSFTNGSDKSENSHGTQLVEYITADKTGKITFGKSLHSLTVGTLQIFIDQYIKNHPQASVDYIHGKKNTVELSQKKNAVGFIFDGMNKNELFPSVSKDGVLPRKTFSMGEAREKRYYIESRKIK